MDIAIRQLAVTASGAETQPHAVGFADLVGYSSLTTQLDSTELATLVSRFDELAMGACVDAGARVVKLVGDAVLFVSTKAGVALEAAWAVVNAANNDDVLPLARAGLDFGDVLPTEGDYFGNPVNVAARVIAVADPGRVAASRAFVEALGADGPTRRDLGQRELKGVGPIELFDLDPPQPSFDPRPRRVEGSP